VYTSGLEKLPGVTPLICSMPFNQTEATAPLVVKVGIKVSLLTPNGRLAVIEPSSISATTSVCNCGFLAASNLKEVIRALLKDDVPAGSFLQPAMNNKTGVRKTNKIFFIAVGFVKGKS